MFHPKYTYINKTVRNFTAQPLLHDIFVEGEYVYDQPSLDEIKKYRETSQSYLWEENLRILNPEMYPVDLSQKLYDRKINTIEKYKDIDYISSVNF